MVERSSQQPSARRGFTLIEVMIVVVIIGVLAAVALPALSHYMKIAKSSEATTNLNNLFKSAAAFYSREHTEKGMQGNVAESCIVGTTALQPAAPTNQKQKFVASGGFKTLGFSIADLVYYGYGISSITTSTKLCGLPPNSAELYTLYAIGDIDGDSTQSTFSLGVGSDPDGQLYHARGFYADHPSE